jgi:threonine synthase
MRHLYIKDESLNPTASFKARGMAVAVSMARELGIRKLAVPSAGNAGGALAAYTARAGLEAYIFMPQDVPQANAIECQQCGAHVTLVDGLITECGRLVAERKDSEGWFDVSTLKEPYRIEGKKTMGYELVEQLHWEVPDVVVYPTGGGTGLIGMWKAFDEMERLGWIGAKRPRMVTVQAEGCAPIVEAFTANANAGAEIANPHTIAAGLRVPRAIGDFLILDILRRSGGTAVSVGDDEIMAAVQELGAATGIFAAPEGAACLPALKKLLARGEVKKEERVVLFNTGSGLKYLNLWQQASGSDSCNKG